MSAIIALGVILALVPLILVIVILVQILRTRAEVSSMHSELPVVRQQLVSLSAELRSLGPRLEKLRSLGEHTTVAGQTTPVPVESVGVPEADGPVGAPTSSVAAETVVTTPPTPQYGPDSVLPAPEIPDLSSSAIPTSTVPEALPPVSQGAVVDSSPAVTVPSTAEPPGAEPLVAPVIPVPPAVPVFQMPPTVPVFPVPPTAPVFPVPPAAPVFPVPPMAWQPTPVVPGPVAPGLPAYPPSALPPMPQPAWGTPLPAQAAPARQGFQMNENFFGHNLLPILASVLGLIGLVFLGILVVPRLSDPVKIVLMFAISAAVGVLGYVLNARHSSVMTRALIGTGIGGIFISILVTHLYFHALNDISAFSLLAVWIVASMWVSKHVQSVLIASLAHAGMVLSIAAALLGGMSDDKLILLIVYQIVATVAIIVTNLLWVRSMYRFGLFASQVMVVFSISTMWARFMGTGPGFNSELPLALITAGFLVQFLGATAIAYLLFVSCARVKNRTTMAVFAVFNTVLWSAVLIEGVTILVAKLAANRLGLASHWIWSDPRTIPVSLVVTLVLAFLPVLVITIAGRRLDMRAYLEYATFIPLALVSAAMLMVNLVVRAKGMSALLGFTVSSLNCSWLSALAVVYLLVAWAGKSSASLWIARAALIADAAMMLVPGLGYQSLTHSWTVGASLGYLAVLLVLAYLLWWVLPASSSQQYVSGLIVAVFLAGEVSVIIVLKTSNITFTTGLIVAITVLALLAVHFVPKLPRSEALLAAGWTMSSPGSGRAQAAVSAVYQPWLAPSGVQGYYPRAPGRYGRAPAGMDMFFRLVEVMVTMVMAGTAYTTGWNLDTCKTSVDCSGVIGTAATTTLVLASLAGLGLIVIMVDRIRVAARATSYAARTPHSIPPKTDVEVLSGIALTVTVVGLLTPYDWFIDRQAWWPWGYPTSLAGMAVALVIVGLGLWSRVKPLRLYGLIVVVACILKLVTVDLGSVNSITRVVAFLGGAAVCFGISALYNYAARHFDKQLAYDSVPDGAQVVPSDQISS
ncbi:MAG: DUF2339 domain-containing protein [Propionibacteriaceae bacterium]|nr:DUF2339 domain-containing protein [Propionibacteriaceae bacterium]